MSDPILISLYFTDSRFRRLEYIIYNIGYGLIALLLAGIGSLHEDLFLSIGSLFLSLIALAMSFRYFPKIKEASEAIAITKKAKEEIFGKIEF